MNAGVKQLTVEFLSYRNKLPICGKDWMEMIEVPHDKQEKV